MPFRGGVAGCLLNNGDWLRAHAGIPLRIERARGASPEWGEIRQPRASGAKPWVDEQIFREAPTGRDSSIPDMVGRFSIEFDYRVLHQQMEFVLKCRVVVMLVVIGEIDFAWEGNLARALRERVEQEKVESRNGKKCGTP